MESQGTAHRCRCQSTRRTAVLMFGGEDSSFNGLQDIVDQMSLRYCPDMSAVVVNIGPGLHFSSAPCVADFFRQKWPRQSAKVTACWIDPTFDVARQLHLLAKARPLQVWASARESQLADILESDRIETWFQPVFERSSLALWGYECLARAKGRQGDNVSPADMFRWAKEDNLEFQLDRACRETHIHNIARVNQKNDLNFLINFLPTVIYDPKVCLKTTFAAARKAKINPARVIFEVVEPEKVLESDVLSAILDKYRAAGFRVALDDLGAGHAGLTLLGDISPDLIKLDRMLVSKSTTSRMHRSICQSMVSVARDCNRMILAEGVETEEEYRLFSDLGVDLFQGFLFGKPAAVPATQALIEPLGPDTASSLAA